MATAARTAGDISITGFLSLAAVSGVTIGMSNIVVQLFAIHIGADAFQIGIIGAMESMGMMLLTLPAGFIIARHGAKVVYAVASLGPFFLYLLMPLVTVWWLIAVLRLLIGICIPFRTVSMSSAFLGALKRIGHGKAGWYRASLTMGMAVIGPGLATFLTGQLSFLWCFLLIAGLFGLMSLFSLSFFPTREDAASFSGANNSAVAAPTGIVAQLHHLLRNPDVLESCAIDFMSGATGSLFATFILLVAMSLPGLVAQDGVTVLLIDGIVTVTALSFGARILHHLHRRQAYAAGLLLATAALVTVANADGLGGLILGGILLSLGSALVHLVNMVLLAGLPGEKSKAAGLYQLSQMLGSATGALTGGLLSKFMPLQSVFIAWIPLLLMAALPIWLFGRRANILSST